MVGRQFQLPETTFDARGVTYRVAILKGPALGALRPLFQDAFGREFSLDWLQLKYGCERDGLEGFACVALTEQGDAAGSVGLLPWAARLGDRIEIAGQLVDVATASEHRGRGLFVRLAELVGDICERAGVGFLYGFPNEAAYPIWTQKLGYRHLDDLVEYRLPVRTVWAERVARRTRVVRPVYDRYVARTLQRLLPSDPTLENSVLGEGFAGIERDRAFYAYKTSFGQSQVVGLDGGRAWLAVRHGLLVGDLEASSEAELDATVRSLRRLAVRLGAHQILFQASRETRFSYLAGPVDASSGLPVIYKTLGSEIPAERLRFTFGDLDNF